MLGAFTVLSAVSAAMIDAGVAGSIVSTASMAGVSGAPNMSAYSASKAAIIGLTKSAAKDLAPAGIRVNAVSPAFIGPGRMWENQVAAQAADPESLLRRRSIQVARQMIAIGATRPLGSPDEVARVVASCCPTTPPTSPASTSRSRWLPVELPAVVRKSVRRFRIAVRCAGRIRAAPDGGC